MAHAVPKAPVDPLSPDLAWLAASLWAGCDVAEGVGELDATPIETFTTLPNSTRPRLLVPMSGRVARSALRQYNDGMTQVARIRKASVGTVLGIGGARLLGGRVHLLPASESPPISALMDDLRGVFDRRRLEIAVFVGERDRPNRKPVLQVSTDRGEVLGYAKVGWNPSTRRLVANEGRVLRQMAATPPMTFRTPGLLHEGRFGDLGFIVVSAFGHTLLRRGRFGTAAPFAVVREIALRAGSETSTLSASEYARGMSERIEAIADDARRAMLAELHESVETQAGEALLMFGSWHGDLTPWNMSRTRSTPYVWDWERSGGPVPIGLDVLHHWFQFGTRGDRRSVIDAASAHRAAVSRTLVRLGVHPRDHELLLDLYLLELLLRFEEAEEPGAPLRRASVELEAAIRQRLRR